MNRELPEGWSAVTLDEVIESMKNGLYKPVQAYADNGTACLRMYNIDDGGIVWKDLKRMKLSPAEVDEYGLLPGDMLVNRVNSRELVGKAAIIPEGLEPCVFESKNIRVRFDRRVINPEFANYALLLWGRHHFSKNAQQVVGMASISQPQIAAFPLPLAPLSEQLRIVAKLKALIGMVAATRGRLKKTATTLERFRQSVLAAACAGRLTADWRQQHPNSGTAEDLISEVGKGRRERLAKLRAMPTRHRHVAVNDFDNLTPNLRGDLDLPDLPDGWCWVDLRFVMNPEEPFCYGVVQPGADDARGPRLIRVCDIDGGRVTKDNLRGIPPSIHAAYQRSMLRGGEVLVSIVGTIGRAAIASPDLAGVNIARAIAKIPVREFEASFVLLWLSTSRAVNWMVGDAREVARKTLNLEQLRTLPMPLPPLAEQQEIVRRVEAMFALGEQIEARLELVRTSVKNLTPSLLAQAFRGELVPTESELARQERRAYEPANVLIERIRRERTTSTECVAGTRAKKSLGTRVAAIKRSNHPKRSGAGRSSARG